MEYLTTTKPPPHNMEAEQSVLGAIILRNDTLIDVSESLKPDHFYRPQHKLIYQAMLDLNSDNHPIDLITVTDKLKAEGNLDKAGGYIGVATLANMVPTAANATHYAKIVRDKAILRAVIQKASRILQQAYSEEFDSIDDLLTTAQSEICDIETNAQGGLVALKDEVVDHLTDIEKRDGKRVTGIPTGHITLDLWTAGYQPGHLIIIAARPSMGKTSYSIQIGAEAAIKHGKKVAVFSLEMTRKQLMEKLLVNVGMVDAQRVRIGKLDEEDWANLHKAANKLYKSGVFIDDGSSVTALDIKNRCRRMKQQIGLDMVIIDYLQLIKSHVKTDNYDREIGQITLALKGLAKELEVPVILLSQLSRDCEKRADKRPVLSDLRYSGSIEQDADIVMFLYRDDYYNPNSKKKGITELIIRKQREGPTGTLELYFQKQFSRFNPIENVAGGYEPQPPEGW